MALPASLDPVRRDRTWGGDERGLVFRPPGVELVLEKAYGQYHARLIGREEVEAVLRLYREADFRPEYMTAEQWDWRFFGRNPELGLLPAIFSKDGRLIAIYPMTLRPVWTGGHELLVGQANATLVHPEYRGGGRVYLALLRFTFDVCWSHGVHFGVGGGANEAALKVGQKLTTYRHLMDLTVYERRLSWRPALRRRLGGFGAPLAALADAFQRPPRVGNEYFIEEVSAAGSEFDALWQRKRGCYRMLLRRDARELRWRWFENPVRSLLLAARRGDTLEGFTVLRHHQDPASGARLTTVLDLFTGLDQELDGVLLDAAASAAIGARSDFMHFAAFPGCSALPLLGRSPWRPARKAPDHVIVAPCSYDPAAAGVQTEYERAFESKNWYLCQGDWDFLD